LETSQGVRAAAFDRPNDVSPVADFDTVYSQNARFIWRVLRGMGVPDALIEDAVQDVFVVVHRRLAEFDGRHSIRTWLFAIAYRVSRDHLRRARPMVADLGAALSTALTAISGQAISCELGLPQPTKGELDLALVNVVYSPSDGSGPRVLPQDAHAPCDAGANGWQYADGNQKIKLCGQTCDVVRGDASARVDVVLGCPAQSVQ
jgi:RNA polymerase sigma factor (sigma-70 family)